MILLTVPGASKQADTTERERRGEELRQLSEQSRMYMAKNKESEARCSKRDQYETETFASREGGT